MPFGLEFHGFPLEVGRFLGSMEVMRNLILRSILYLAVSLGAMGVGLGPGLLAQEEAEATSPPAEITTATGGAEVKSEGTATDADDLVEKSAEVPEEAKVISKGQLRFSNSAQWDRVARGWTGREPKLLGHWREFVSIAPPPSNTSEDTEVELSELHRMQRERDEETILKIKEEQTLDGFNFDLFHYKTVEQQSPEAAKLLKMGQEEISPIVFTLKAKFDRVRPSVLDPTLQPVIDVPGHPSYPSGHAAQAYLVAYLLSDIDPATPNAYFTKASKIAIRREEAGVHYGSDTLAGKSLARQVYNQLSKQHAYLRQLELAKAEFKSN